MTQLLAIRRYSSSLRLIALQILSLAGIGLAWPYINVYLKEIGFSGALIGTLGSGGAIISLVLTPLLNQIADRLLLHRRLYMLYLGGFVLACIIFASSSLRLLIIAAVLLFRVTVSPSLTLGMQLTMTHLISSGKAILGQMRAYASLGFGLASLTAGWLFTQGGYPLIFWMAALLTVFSILTATVFPGKPKEKAKVADDEKLPRNPGFYVLAASTFFVWICNSNSYAFIFVHFTQNLAVPQGDIGLWAALLGILEVPFYYLMDLLLPRVRIRIAYILGLLGIALYTLLLGFVPNLLMLALLLLLRGLAWPSFQLSSFMLVNAISRPRNAATNQALVHVTMPGIALVLTGSLFGWAFDNLGPQGFFALCSLMAVISVGVVLAGFRLFDIKRGQSAV